MDMAPHLHPKTRALIMALLEQGFSYKTKAAQAHCSVRRCLTIFSYPGRTCDKGLFVSRTL